MNIFGKLKALQTTTARAIDLYESISDVFGVEAVEKLIEFAAEIINLDAQSDTDIALEVSTVLTFDALTSQCILEIPSSESTILLFKNGDWIELT